MTALRISEAISVQFPMVRHAAEIGWTPIPPEVAKQKRGGEAGMLLRDELEEKLAAFNPWLPTGDVRSLIETLEAIPPTIDGNRDMLSWLRGERSWYDTDQKRHRRIQLIDFENPARNALHVSWEWKLKPPTRKGNRADRPRHHAVAPLRGGDPRTDRRAAAVQRHASHRLLVRRHLECFTPLPGALEGAFRRNLQVRGAVVIRAHRFPDGRCTTGCCSTSKTARPGNPSSDSTSARPSTRSSPAARTTPNGAASSGIRKGPERPSPCSRPPAWCSSKRTVSATPRSSSSSTAANSRGS